jgi:hypothetical protein
MLFLTSLMVVGIGLAPGTAIVIKAEPIPELDAKFQRREGWVGADGVYSAVLSDKKTLWLFSDTWVGSIRAGKRKDVAMVNNTVGVQEGTGSEAKLTFSIARADDDKPKALFTPPDGRGWFWLNAGTVANDKLYVFLPRLEKTNKGGAFGFRGIDLWLGTVDRPGDAPTTWKTKYSKVPCAEFAAERKRSFGSALQQDKDHLYIYGYEERPGKPLLSRTLLVARAPINHLSDFSEWRFYANGKWVTDPADSAGKTNGLATEFSVTYLPSLKQYVLVYTENGLSERIVGRFSEKPEGPWSDPVLLYSCPEMKQSKKVFTYAAKAHPQLASGNELIISYVVNAFDFASVINDPDLYWPRFVKVELK